MQKFYKFAFFAEITANSRKPLNMQTNRSTFWTLIMLKVNYSNFHTKYSTVKK